MMKYFVNDNCIGCGLCCGICPEVFEMTDAGTAKAIDEDAVTEQAKEAMFSCPVEAIEEG